jgi:hypothetical protein
MCLTNGGPAVASRYRQAAIVAVPVYPSEQRRDPPQSVARWLRRHRRRRTTMGRNAQRKAQGASALKHSQAFTDETMSHHGPQETSSAFHGSGSIQPASHRYTVDLRVERFETLAQVWLTTSVPEPTTALSTTHASPKRARHITFHALEHHLRSFHSISSSSAVDPSLPHYPRHTDS